MPLHPSADSLERRIRALEDLHAIEMLKVPKALHALAEPVGGKCTWNAVVSRLSIVASEGFERRD